MARVLAISSQTVFGPVGNSAAVPALQEHGHEVLVLPTTLLSNHPGLARPVGRTTDAALLKDILHRLEDMCELSLCNAVMTGYFASAEQVSAVAETITAMKKAKPGLMVLVDPVIGDDTALYVPEAVAAAIRDHLMPLATITTPNRFELSWLTGMHVGDDQGLAAARLLDVAEVIVTSAETTQDTTTTLLVESASVTQHTMATHHNVPNGTGDFLAGQYLAHRLLMPSGQAFPAAMARLQRAIGSSAGAKSLHLTRN